MSVDQWRWFGNAGHFIAGRYCQFHMTTEVGDYLVSTVGEYHPDGPQERMQEVGIGRFYETMVFPLGSDEECHEPECMCGQREVAAWSNVDVMGYNLRGDAIAGHLAMCRKWDDQP